MAFERVSSGAPWEGLVGYCRAVRAGNLVVVSGTAPVGPDGQTFAPGDAYAQTRRCLQIIVEALGRLGAHPADVVRTRLYVTDITRWREYGRAHAEVFAAHPPATSMIQVAALIDPAMLVEIEAEAVCAGEANA